MRLMMLSVYFLFTNTLNSQQWTGGNSKRHKILTHTCFGLLTAYSLPILAVLSAAWLLDIGQADLEWFGGEGGRICKMETLELSYDPWVY